MTDREEIEVLARRLDEHDDYRVVRRFHPRQRYRPEPEDPAVKRTGLFLDVETTGLAADSERIIELALVPFEFAADGRIFTVGEAFDELEDPNRPIPAAIVQLTGITDAMVAGRRIDDEAVAAMLEDTAVVIAHNAAFDRRFAERRFPAFESKAWACSLCEVPWREEGIESAKLEYIAYRYGFFYSGHRAAVDCLVGIHLLAHPLPASGRPALQVLLDRARETTYRLWATDTPYEARTALRARGYRWNNGEDGRPRAWFVDLAEADRGSEIEFLRRQIYHAEFDPPVDRITCFNRYSDRI